MRLLRGLAGRVLPCGCLIGVYETYGGGVVSTIDAVGRGCNKPNHQLHRVIESDSREGGEASVDSSSSGRM